MSIVNRDGDDVRTLARDVLLPGGRRHRFRWDGRTESGRVARTASITSGSGCGARAARSPPRASCSWTPFHRVRSCGTCPRAPSRPTERVAPTAPRSGSPARSGARGCSCIARTCAARASSRRRTSGGRMRHRTGTVAWRGTSPPRPGRTCWWCGPRTQPGTSARGASRRGAPKCAAIPGVAVRYVDAYATRPVVEPGQRARLRRPRRRTALPLERPAARHAAGHSARLRNVRLALPCRSGFAARASRCSRCGWDHAGTRRRSPCRPGAARRCWSCCRMRPGRRATGSRRTATAIPTCCPEDPQVTPAAPVRGRRSAARALPATSRSLLRFLDGEGLRYDITTDVALAAPGAPPLGRYAGVLYAGAPRFSPARVQRLLRAYVTAGGRLAWAGRGGFDWTVHVTRGGRATRHSVARPAADRAGAVR